MANEKVKLIREMCRKYLGPPWQKATENDIKIERLVSGLSGLVFRCHLNAEIPPKVNVPRDVICRLNDFCTLAQKVLANVNDGNESRTTETVVFTVLGERGLGPKLVAIFPGGRFEEFIEVSNGFFRIELLYEHHSSKRSGRFLNFWIFTDRSPELLDFSD